ncbi:hypothetical protein AAEO56_11290 [Flavobacterium sp. DGU11]|uniref:Lipoprotein n=1 Tax=Flavobacterium arundinis TaxID=3139143 RepID=A0ABU9HXE9_9FLAO
MKKVYQMLLVALVVVSCNKTAKTEDANAETTDAETKTETPAVAYVFNEADWVETDLSATKKEYPILVKLPKTAKIGPNDISPEDITVTINENTAIDINSTFENTTAEAVKRFKAQSTGASTKMLKEDADGFIYEELATEGFDAQYRFYFVLKSKGEGCYVFHNQATGVVGGTKEAAEKMYEAIKSSAKVK